MISGVACLAALPVTNAAAYAIDVRDLLPDAEPGASIQAGGGNAEDLLDWLMELPPGPPVGLPAWYPAGAPPGPPVDLPPGPPGGTPPGLLGDVPPGPPGDLPPGPPSFVPPHVIPLPAPLLLLGSALVALLTFSRRSLRAGDAPGTE